MVSRHQVLCLACHGIVVLRIQVSATMSPDDLTSGMVFVVPCPHCGVLLHARLASTPDRAGLVALVSEDVSEMALDSRVVAPTLAVATDVPVHFTLVEGSSSEAELTPFIRLWQALDAEGQIRLADRVGAIATNHERAFAALRRSVDAFNRGHGDEVMKLLFATDGREDDGELGRVPPPVLLGFAFKRFFEPIGKSAAVEGGRVELYELLLEASKRNAQAMAIESAAMWQRGLARHRADVLNRTVALLGDPDPIIAACCAEELAIAGRLDDFRVMRDDFEVLKARFLDVFELGSTTLAYLSRVANIAKRGEASAYAGEPSRLSLSKALRSKAETRETWLSELPAAQSVFEPLSRRWRNLIGHHLVRYDLARGVLVLNDGSEQRYLTFMTSYLAAVRLSQYLAEAVIVLTRLDDTVALAKASPP